MAFTRQEVLARLRKQIKKGVPIIGVVGEHLQHVRRQRVRGSDGGAERHGNQIQRATAHSTAIPCLRSRSHSAISGRPTSAFGSSP